MHDATVDRLVKLVSEEKRGGNGSRDNNQKPSPPSRPVFQIHLAPAEGWFSLFLLATVLYSTMWCVEAANWVDHLSILSLTTALGIVCGMITAKQRRFPSLVVHLVVVVFALLLASWQTAGAYFDGNLSAFYHNFGNWVSLAVNDGTSGDDSIFLLFITALSFLLAYTSVWLVYRLRSPWLMIVANSIVLLINLSYIANGYIVFMIVFLIAALLLLLRFNLYDSVMLWRRQRLRFPDDLGWDFMQAGALISIGIIVLSFILPWGYMNEGLSQVWNADNSPWTIAQNTWNRLISVNGDVTASNHGSFRDSLTLAGNPNLNQEIVMTVKSNDSNQYLESLSYVNYDGRGWGIDSTNSQTINNNQVSLGDTINTHTVNQTVKMVNPPGEQSPYLLGASQIAMVSQDARLVTSKSSGQPVTWLKANGKLAAGMTYTVTSMVSSTDEATLRSVPFPADAPRFSTSYDGSLPPTYFDPTIVHDFTQLPRNLDPNILRVAQSVTASGKNPYDKMVLLETYLRSNYRYNVNINLPPGQEGVSWFLFRSGNQGFCNYFATAMAVMARDLGMPARMVVGYTHGKLDTKTHEQVIRGVDAHAWTQVYFAGYGWINFEPSAGFTSFDRPLPNQYSKDNSSTLPGGATPTTSKGLGNRRGLIGPDSNGGNNISSTTNTGPDFSQQTGMFLGGVVLLILVGLMVFGLWWKRLFRNQRVTLQIYGRIRLLAAWAGIEVVDSKTPLEQIEELATIDKIHAKPLNRFGDIYVRDIWANPESPEHPLRSGEVAELPDLWKTLQPGLFGYVLRHPHFLFKVPARAVANLRKKLGGGVVSHRRRNDLQEAILDDSDDLEALG